MHMSACTKRAEENEDESVTLAAFMVEGDFVGARIQHK